MEKTALVFAAGLGTRLKPLTDTLPKALVPYQGTPLLERVLLKLKSSGFTRVVINVHHFADKIEQFVYDSGGFGMDISFSDERDLLRETGGGIRHAEKYLSDGTFLVHNVDIVSDIDLNWFYSQHKEDALATLLVSERETSRYFLFDDAMRLKGWVNISTGEVKSPYSDIRSERCQVLTKRYRTLAFGGMHVISPSIFPLMKTWPERFSIVDFYLSMAQSHIIRGSLPPSGASLVDVGKLSQLV